MKGIAAQLSADVPFVRVDLYEINGKVYFGELTLYPGCGFEEFHPDEWDEKLGEMIDLSVVDKLSMKGIVTGEKNDDYCCN